MVKYSWSETTGHGGHVNWQNNTNSFQKKEEKIEEDNTYVLVNKHGHHDVHVLL